MTDPGSKAPAAAWRIEVGFVSDPGRERDRNEDACAVFVPYQGEEDLAPIGGLFAVADGMGGHDAGDLASQHVVEGLTRTFAPGQRGPDGAALPLPVPETIEELIRRLHGELREVAASRGAERGIGSTLALAVVDGETLHVTSVGDSRCYRFREQRLTRLTEDHSWVAEQVRAGLLSEEEAEQHPNRNVLTQCLGIGGTPPIRLRQEALEDGDRFLLCSDGLHGQVPEDVMARVLADESPQAAAQRLTDLANERGGPDNITVVVFDAHRPRLEEALATTLPGAAAVADSRSRALPQRRDRLSLALLAAGLLLLAGAVGAWFWFRPAEATAAGPARTVIPSDSARPDSAPIDSSVPSPRPSR